MINLFLLSSLFLGLICSSFLPNTSRLLEPFSTPVCAALLLVIGWQMGRDLSWMNKLRTHAWLTVLICASTVVGSLGAAALFAAAVPGLPVRDGLLIASGLSFYSLSSVLIEQAGETSLALLSFLSNFMREFLSLLAAGFIARTFGILTPIAATASASDSGAPVIAHASGDEYIPLCLSCAFVLSVCVPLLTSIFL